MLDRRRWAGSGWAGALFFAVAFLALSLLGYDPADPPGRAAEPPNAPPNNPCGPVGATLAHLLYANVGRASYLVLFAAIVADLLAFRRRKVPEPALRAFGFALVVAVGSALVQRFDPGHRPASPVGSGGYVGAALSGFLEGQFGLAGMLLILSAMGLIGLALCHEILLAWPIRELSALIRGPREPAANPAPESTGTGLVLSPPVEVDPRPRLAPPPVNRQLPPRPRPSLDAPATAPPAPRLAPPPSNGHAVPVVPLDGSYQLPPLELLEPPPARRVEEDQAKIHSRAMLLEKTLLEFGCQVRVVQINTGPVITQFEIELEAGLRVAKINSVATDLAIALAVPSVRIVSPIPNKTTVGVEVPNERRTMVRLSEVIEGVGPHLDKFRIPLFLGRDVNGTPLAFDLADMPHLLIAGRTGTGKSVCLNAMILSILMTRTPEEVKLILIDPKVVELTQFKRIPHLMNPVVTDMKKAEALLAWACDKMDERYGLLARAGVRNIASYNQLGEAELYNRLRPEDDQEWERLPKYLPSIVIIIDEVGEMIMTVGKEVETQIVRIAQKARAAGIHLILATQKPTVDVITGLIKSNLPARIAFQVTNRNDSRVVLDEMGAEKLLGLGDMLFLIPGTSNLVRAQGAYAEKDVERVTEYLAQYPQVFSRELTQLQISSGNGKGGGLKDRDELYESAIEIVIREGKGSTSLLQRALGIGYGRAARMMDYMRDDGIVSDSKGNTSAREVLITLEEWEALKNGGEPSGEAA